MSKTADFKKLVKSQLDALEGVTYYRRADPSAEFPYKTFSYHRIFGDENKEVYTLTVDVWDHSQNSKRVESIADDIEELFTCANLPQDSILPTIFRDSRYPVEDSDKDIQHEQLNFLVNFYNR